MQLVEMGKNQEFFHVPNNILQRTNVDDVTIWPIHNNDPSINKDLRRISCEEHLKFECILRAVHS